MLLAAKLFCVLLTVIVISVVTVIIIDYYSSGVNGVKDGFLNNDDEVDGDIYPEGPLPPAQLKHKHQTTKHVRVSIIGSTTYTIHYLTAYSRHMLAHRDTNWQLHMHACSIMSSMWHSFIIFGCDVYQI